MKTLFIIIGVVVILGILFSSGSVGAGLCIRGVGCVASQSTGITFDREDEQVQVQTGRQP